MPPGKIEDAQQQLREWPIPAPDACAAFRRASRAVTKLYNLVLAPIGLKATQFITLQAIASHGELAQWRLADEHGIAPETLSRRLQHLRRAGLIAVRIGTERKGERLCRLTPAGMQILRKAFPYWDRAQERLRTVIGDTEWEPVLKTANHVALAAQLAESAKLPNLIRPTSLPRAEHPALENPDVRAAAHPAGRPGQSGSTAAFAD